MATAKKCDVCGKLYEYYEMDVSKCNAIWLVRVHLDGRIDHKMDPMDLCPECYRSIEDHIDGIKYKGRVVEGE